MDFCYSYSIKNLRGGSFIELATTFVLIILFWQMVGVGESLTPAIKLTSNSLVKWDVDI